METTTINIINAIAGLWKLVLALAIFLSCIFFRKPLYKTLAGLKNFHFKRGQTEFAVEGGATESPSASSREIQSATTPAPEKLEQPQQPETQQPRDGFFFQMHRAFIEERIEDLRNSV